ncbi:MAG: sulfatase-like hydrolase/transferase, partial [Bacteroidetes bacterium]|nr:sulfatase-like hydrolase/transferase [Bacteroidota bacterium]
MKKIQLYVILVFFCLLPAEQTSAGEKQEQGVPPNILFILIDDMGWKDISCAGSSYYETPNIDKLASAGMRFLNAYSPAPVCTPTRGAIFSGKAPARTQLTAVFSGPSGPDDRLYHKSKYSGEEDQFLEARHRHALPRQEVIIPQALAEAGYETAFFGKWHIGECRGYYPDDRGFHVAKGYRIHQQGSRSHWMKDFAPDAANLEGAGRDAYVADALTTQCVEFIKGNKDKPWMAVLSHYLVHNPVQPKPQKLAKYENKATTDQNSPGYAAMVESVDESVGRLISAIGELGMEDNTLVIFTSDNGGLTLKNTSNYPLMGGKSFPFEAGMKVPFIVKWPGKIAPGTTAQRIVGMDIYPTMLGAAGLPLRPEQHVDGLDLMPLLTKSEGIEKRPIIFHFPHYSHATGPFSSIIEDDWKLIKFYNDEKGAYLLYDLAKDPEEQNNLADAEVKMRDKLIRHLEKSLREMDAEMPIPNPGFNPDLKVDRMHMEFTKELADRERKMFESRLQNARKPNIIYILADDMSYYDMSGLGQKHFDTPNLDDLMHEGLFFHQAYAGSPECAPSRGSLLTGMHMGHCRIRCNRSFRGQEYLEDEDVTIAEMMKKAGYATGMFGKWGVGVPGSPGTPDKQGFDYSIGYYDQLRAHGYFPNYLMENGEVIPLPENYGYDMRNSYRHSGSLTGRHSYDEDGKIIPRGVKDPAKATFSQTMIQEKALEFINKHKDQPFFMYYPTQLPHGPVIAPDISKFMDKPWDMKHKEWAAMVELLDTHVGQIVILLEELGLRENTLILFSSDNGYAHWGYNGRDRYLDDPIFDNKGPWDKGKFIATDGGSRVPFLASWPSVIQPGSESDAIVALYDIFPTACEIADEKPAETDGKSLLPILKGELPEDG